MSAEDEPTGHKLIQQAPGRVLGAALAGVMVAVGASESLELLMLPAAFLFGALVRRPWALLLAFVPFLLSLSQDPGGGDPPGWVVGLVFEVPLLGLVIGSGVIAGLLAQRIRHKP